MSSPPVRLVRPGIVALLAFGCLVGYAAPARADLTAFFGLSPTPSTRSAKGFAVGLNLLVVGFEFEYANTREDERDAAPGLQTYMFDALVITPTGGTQLYLTAGGGLYREAYRDVHATSFGTNFGGGIKFALAGPLRIRLDYRVFALRGGAIYKNPQRFYAGINVQF